MYRQVQIGKIIPDHTHEVHMSIISFCLLSLYKRFEQKANIRGCDMCIGMFRCDHTSEYCTVDHFERLFAGDIILCIVLNICSHSISEARPQPELHRKMRPFALLII